ncbi:hypothetical protein ACS0TY_017691 [Phlomoides rotata]
MSDSTQFGFNLTTGLPEISAGEMVDLPFYFVGHNNGTLLQVFTGSHFCEKVPKVHYAPLLTANASISYNNRPSSEVIPYSEQYGNELTMVLRAFWKAKIYLLFFSPMVVARFTTTILDTKGCRMGIKVFYGSIKCHDLVHLYSVINMVFMGDVCGHFPEALFDTIGHCLQANVIIIGAGLAGLGAAKQLMAFGFKVMVLEGRKHAGGRVYTKKLEGSNMTAAVDLGGSVLTGTFGNPLGILARQLSSTLHTVRDKCPLYRVDGTPMDPDLDRKVEASFNQLLDKLSKSRQLMVEVSQDVSLGAALDTFREAFNEEEMKMCNWHLANLEYANSCLLSRLSLAFWYQESR